MITTQGKLIIQRYMAGQVNSIGGTIAVGLGASAEALADRKLTYEFERATVNVTSVDFINQRIIYKTTLPQETVGTIYEIGLYSGLMSSTPYTSSNLLSFDSLIESWTAGTYGSNNVRYGADNLRLTAAASATTVTVLDPVAFDLSGYSTVDQFSMALNADANTASVRVRLRGLDPTSYYEYTNSALATGYNIFTWTKSNMTLTGTTVTWASISSVEIAVTAKAAGTTNVDLDGMRIEDLDTPATDSVLVARKVLVTPQIKTGVSPMDVEYALDISI